MNKHILQAVTLTLILTSIMYFSFKNHTEDQYANWKQLYAKQFTQFQDSYRKIIFYKNLQMIQIHNSNPLHSYKLGLTPFTAMKQQQFQLTYLRSKQVNNIHYQTQQQFIPVNEDIDWQEKGMISPVKMMGNCAASWAFTATGQLQSHGLMKNQTVILSEQQLIDCSQTYGNYGCNNDGEAFQALEYVRDHGLETESAYPYIQKVQKCKMKGGPFKITGFSYVKGCGNLTTTLQKSAIGVTVDATNWPHYKSGIFTACPPGPRANLQVLLVGSIDTYWKIKNSWGTGWGQDGYIRMSHTAKQSCGMCYFKGTWGLI